MKKTIVLLCLMFAGCGYGIRIVDTDDEWKMKLIRKNIEIISLYMVIDSLETELYKCKEGNAMSQQQMDWREILDSAEAQTDRELASHPVMKFDRRAKELLRRFGEKQ